MNEFTKHLRKYGLSPMGVKIALNEWLKTHSINELMYELESKGSKEEC